MDINVREFDSIMGLVDALVSVYSTVGGIFSTSLNGMLDELGFPLTIPAWLGGDLTPLALMLGGVSLYVIYQFLIWLLNLVT